MGSNDPKQRPTLPVAVDAMGGDRAPAEVVKGVVRACKDGAGPILLVGNQDRLISLLEDEGAQDWPIELVHAAETIGMSENPSRAARSKRQSSMHLGFELLKDKRAAAFVSAGNTGAMLTVGMMTARRLDNCNRPAIATSIPSAEGATILLDVGANVDVRAAHLVQFGLMGAAYSKILHKIERPSVGLLSNGTEPTKGTDTLREAHRLLTQVDVNYVGFIEGRDIPAGRCDVVVTDGLTGNIVLKTIEGVGLALFDRIRTQLEKSVFGRLGAGLLRSPLRAIRDEFDWERVGGAPLLGLDGIAIVAHGAATARAITGAIRLARRYEALDLVDHVRIALEEAIPEKHASTSELPITRSSGPYDRIE